MSIAAPGTFDHPLSNIRWMHLRILDEHLLDTSNVPQASNCVQGQVRRDRRTTLKGAALHMSIRSDNRAICPRKMVFASLDGKVGKANVERVSRGD